MSDVQVFRPRRSYGAMAGIGLLVALLFAWELTRNFAGGTLFFIGCALLFALVNLGWAVSTVELTETGLVRRRPLSGPLPIAFRQIATCEESGRMGKSISLIYYPLADNGLLDLDTPRSCFLPGVERQDELLAILQRKIVD
ncbi:MAG: hypothetical protein WBO46_15395 [Caldilineaceae bacterium]